MKKLSSNNHADKLSMCVTPPPTHTHWVGSFLIYPFVSTVDLWWILSQAWVLPIHLTNSGAPSIHTGLVPAPAGCSVCWEQRPTSALMWHHSWRRGQALHKPVSWWHQTLLSAEEAVDCPCWVVWMWFPFLIPPPLLELRGYLMYQDTITHCIVLPTSPLMLRNSL